MTTHTPELLLNTATVIEKVAEYIESLESSRVVETKQEQKKTASKVAEKLSELTGDTMDASLIDKLAETDPQILTLLSKMAGDSNTVEPMGEPKDKTVKTAADMAPAERAFVDWIAS